MKSLLESLDNEHVVKHRRRNSLNEARNMGDPSVLEVLNTSINEELHAWNQYTHFAELCKFKGYDKLASIFEGLAYEEHEHIREYTQRLLFLGGNSTMNPIAMTEQFQPADIVGMLNKVVELETQTIKDYNDRANICFSANDNVTRDLFAHTTSDEEQHLDRVQNELERIEEVGIQNYISEQD